MIQIIQRLYIKINTAAIIGSLSRLYLINKCIPPTQNGLRSL